MMERHQIENQEPQEIASQLTAAFDTHCLTTPVTRLAAGEKEALKPLYVKTQG